MLLGLIGLLTTLWPRRCLLWSSLSLQVHLLLFQLHICKTLLAFLYIRLLSWSLHSFIFIFDRIAGLENTCSSSQMQCLSLFSFVFFSSSAQSHHVSALCTTIVFGIHLHVGTLNSRILLGAMAAAAATLTSSYAHVITRAILWWISVETNITYWSPLSWRIVVHIKYSQLLTTICGAENVIFQETILNSGGLIPIFRFWRHTLISRFGSSAIKFMRTLVDHKCIIWVYVAVIGTTVWIPI